MRISWLLGLLGFLGILGYVLHEPLFYVFFLFFLNFLEAPVGLFIDRLPPPFGYKIGRSGEL
jgi:hypothetical protein